MNISSSIRSITADIHCFRTNTISDSFKVHIAKSYNNDKWIPVLLIVSKGDLNPVDYFNSTYFGLNELTKEFGINLVECKVYIDLMDYLGVFQPFLFRWVITGENETAAYELLDCSISDLPDTDKQALKSYYRSQWSSFTESCLTTEDKIQLISNILSGSIFDNQSVEELQNDFRYKLLHTLNNGKDEVWNLID